MNNGEYDKIYDKWFADTNFEDDYDVAIGWQNMADIEDTVDVQVYPTLEKTNDGVYRATDLAEVIIFNAMPTVVSEDYMLVLNRNAYTADDELWLNVVFEDGTVEEVQIDSKGGYNFDDDVNDDAYMAAYAYVENSDGTYDIVRDSKVEAGIADLYRTGTVAYADPNYDRNQYVSYDSDVADIWDVTGVDSANDEVVAGDFTRNVDVNAVIISTEMDEKNLGMKDGEIRTAWIWDIEQGADEDEEPVDGLIVRTIANNVRNTSAETFSSIRTAVSNRVELSMSEAQANAAELVLQFAPEVDSVRYAIYSSSDSDISADDYSDAEPIEFAADYEAGDNVTIFPVGNRVQDLDDGNVIVIFLTDGDDIYYAAYEIVVD